ncbi:MAG: TRAP transporter small permease [Desulfobacteraceae bacterium]|nr:MAG: TRAP transporter small permease [Desulfobacteraceae bacterium]
MGGDKQTDLARPGSAPHRRSFFGNLVALMNSLGTGWIFVLLLLINADIISRTVFNSPVRGVTEIVGMTIVGCVFLQLAHALKVGRLTRSDIILARLERNHLQIKQALEAVYNLVGGFVLSILVVYSIPLFIEAWTINEYEGAEGDFTAPVWPVKLIIVIGSLVAALQCLANCYRIIKEMRADKSAARGGPS